MYLVFVEGIPVLWSERLNGFYLVVGMSKLYLFFVQTCISEQFNSKILFQLRLKFVQTIKKMVPSYILSICGASQ